MFDSSQKTSIKIKHKSNHSYIFCSVMNLTGDCSTTSVGSISGCNAGVSINDLSRLLVHYLTNQHALSRAEAHYSWKFILTNNACQNVYKRGYALPFLQDLKSVSSQWDVIDTFSWTANPFQIHVATVPKNCDDVPQLELCADYADYEIFINGNKQRATIKLSGNNPSRQNQNTDEADGWEE